jgi:hypothetical protein
MKYLYIPFTQRNPFFAYSSDYVRESYGIMLFDNPNQKRTAMPAEWVFLNRLQWGLNSILGHLNATGPWPDIIDRLTQAKESPASPHRSSL